jgi:hypothetical protein
MVATRMPRRPAGAQRGRRPAGPKPEPVILFQQFFKSVGPRTYAAQIKRAANGNHFLVLTEGQRDEKTGELRKSRLFVYSEDFPAFYRLIKASADFAKANPVDPAVKAKRDKMWASKAAEAKPAVAPPSVECDSPIAG